MPAGSTLFPSPIKAGEHYFRIWLAEMFLKNDRDWGSSWYPAVMSSVELKFGNTVTELTHVHVETNLKNFDMKSLNRGISVNHELTTLILFNGGTIRLEAGLLAMQGKSDAKSLVKVLGDFSKLLVVPQLSAALAVAGPLVDGISELVGATDAHPTLRLQNTWTGAGGAHVLRAGYFVVISAEAGEMPPESLFVKNNQLYAGAAQMTGYNYMLFRIDVAQERDDWDSLTAISDPFGEALVKLNDARTEEDPDLKAKIRNEAEKRYGAARLAAFRAPELTTLIGRNQVLAALKQRWEDAKTQLGSGAFLDAVPPTLGAVMRNPISIEDARDLGEIQEEREIWE